MYFAVAVVRSTIQYSTRVPAWPVDQAQAAGIRAHGCVSEPSAGMERMVVIVNGCDCDCPLLTF